MNFKNGIILSMMSVLFVACATITPAIQTVSVSEAFKYEQKYLAEYESEKTNNSNALESSLIIKWIQPSNKKELCKVYVGFYQGNDRTVKENYKIFWDGKI